MIEKSIKLRFEQLMESKDFLRPKKVLLLVPPTGLYIREDRCQTPIDKLKTVAPRPPVDLLYIAAILRREGTVCKVCDYPVQRRTVEDLKSDLQDFNPDWAIVSITTPGLKNDLNLIRELKESFPGVHFIAKGAHFNAGNLDERTLQDCPALFAVIRGEYEDVFIRWMKAECPEEIPGLTYRWNETIIRNPGKGYIEDLDSLPFPARELIDNSLYQRPDIRKPQTTIVTSRGCPYDCTFCLSNLVSGKKVRLRSPRNVINEIIECRDTFNIRDFLFRSDTFTINKKWLEELCKLIKNECPDIHWACNSRVDLFTPDVAYMLKDAGCWLVAFGIESGSQCLLDSVKKDASLEEAYEAVKICRKAGMLSSIYILLGLPEETSQTFKQTRDMLIRLNPDFVEFFYVYPFPGSELYRELVNKKLIEDGTYPEAAYAEPAFATRHFTLEELKKQRFYLWRKFYFRPGYIGKIFWRNINHPGIIWNYFLHGLAQIKAFFQEETK